MTDMDNPTTLGNLGTLLNNAAFTAFVNNLILELDPAIMAGVANTNGAWIGQLVSNLNTSTVVDIVDDLDAAWMVDLMTDMNNPTTLGNLGTLLNNAAFTAFVNNLILQLDPTIMAGVLNTNGTWVGQLVSNLNTSMVVDIVNALDSAWMIDLMTDLNNPHHPGQPWARCSTTRPSPPSSTTSSSSSTRPSWRASPTPTAPGSASWSPT